MNQHIIISAMEISGDEYASWLIQSLKKLNPSYHFSGIAGDLCQQAGMALIAHFNQHASMALFDIIKQMRHYRSLQQKLINHLKENQPDLLVLVDSGAFNLKLAKEAKRIGIPVIYYIPPKVWAWGGWRLPALKKNCALLACLYPFETAFFEAKNCPAISAANPRTYTRHVKKHLPKRIIAVCPGSRKNEIRHGLPVMLAACSLLKTKYPDICFELIVAHKRLLPQIQQISAEYPLSDSLSYIVDHPKEHLANAYVAIATSGTLTFELAMLQTPMVIGYKMAHFNYLIGCLLVHAKWAGLPNLLANRTIIPELIQDKMTAANIVKHVALLLDEPKQRQRMIAQLRTIAEHVCATQHKPIGNIVHEFLQTT